MSEQSKKDLQSAWVQAMDLAEAVPLIFRSSFIDGYMRAAKAYIANRDSQQKRTSREECGE